MKTNYGNKKWDKSDLFVKFHFILQSDKHEKCQNTSVLPSPYNAQS